MLWQSEAERTSEALEEKPKRECQREAPETDNYDRLLDQRMVSEGCPNVRDDD